MSGEPATEKIPARIASYAVIGGPVPKRGSLIGDAFWRGYWFGGGEHGLRGGAEGSLVEQAYRAGDARHKVQRGLIAPEADPHG